MKLIRDISEVPEALRRGAVTIGNFDGVHRGHARIIERVIASAKRIDGPAVVFTFEPHPVRILRPELAPLPLTWTERKADLLADLGVDWMIAYPTDEDLLSLSAEDFFERIVRQRLDARAMVEGPNFFFGNNRTGDIELLGKLCRKAQTDLEIVEPLKVDGEFVSSSRVRESVRRGNVQLAAELLTRPYRIRGMVTHGAGRGSKIGFPTANINAVDTLLPAEGVYAGRAIVSQREFPAAINIGPNPTFDENVLKVEVHLLDFHETLYSAPLEVDFLERLRDIQPFASVEKLKEQLKRDVEATRKIASS